MRVATYERFGDPTEVLTTGERPMPEPGKGEVRVKMTRSPIHNHDLWMIRGEYGQKPQLPAIGGSEAAGVIDALGEGVDKLKVGMRVTGFTSRGAWAEYFTSPAAALLPLPDAISDDVGCQLVAMPLSALALLDTYPVGEGEWIVQNAANGAVGKTLATVAKKRGTNVVHLVRSEAGVSELAAIGIEGAVAMSNPDWSDRVRALVGKGKITVAIDSVGGEGSAALCKILSSGGKLVAFGSMSQKPMEIDSGFLIFKGIKAEGFWLTKLDLSFEKRAAMIGELVKLVTSGDLDLPVEATFSIADAAKAAAASVKASKHGKVLIQP